MRLLERQDQLEALSSLFAAAAGGHGSLALISGEAGAGKTSLVRAFTERSSSSARVLAGACDALSSPRPLGPLFDLAAGLGEPARRLLRDPERRSDLFQAVMDDLATSEPVLVVIEDAHWADEATLDLLRYLGRRCERARVLLVVTYRDDEVSATHPLRSLLGDLATHPHVHRISVDLLSQEAVRTLASRSDIDVDELYRATDGNPFYVTEVLEATGSGVPATVRDAVLTRAARLDAESRAVLDVAAVIGGRIEPWLLAKFTGPHGEAVDACIDAGLLVSEGGALHFRHQLAEDAVASAIPAMRRAGLHGRVLLALRSRLPTSIDFVRLAHHAEAAGDAEAVLELAPAAARRAAELGAHREAAAQYERALRFADHLPVDQRARLLASWYPEGIATAPLTRCVDVASELIDLAHQRGDILEEARWHGEQAWALVNDGRNPEADAAVNRAIVLLGRLPATPVHAQIYQTQARIRMLDRDYAEAIASGQQAIALARRFELPQVHAGALNATGSSRLIGEDEARGRRELEEGLTIARAAHLDLDIAALLSNLGSGHGEIYRFDLAERYLMEGIAFARDHDLDGYREYEEAWLSLTYLFTGRWSEAADVASRVIRTPSVETISQIMAWIALGRVRARRGDPEAWDAHDAAQQLAEPTGTLQRIAPMRAARAEAAWLEGRVERAVEEARAAFEMAAQYRHPWHIGELGYWRWKAGDLAEPPAGAAEPYALQMRGDWRGAASAWIERGCPYEAARAMAESDDEDALRDAFATFDRLGARPAANMTAQRLRELGASSIPRGARPETRDNAAGLTRREREVLALVAEGLTNGEIADRLYLAPKTIEHHVTGILAKLDAADRHDAVARAAAMGINPLP